MPIEDAIGGRVTQGDGSLVTQGDGSLVLQKINEHNRTVPLCSLITGDNNSVASIKNMRESVVSAEKQYNLSHTATDVMTTAGLTIAAAPAVKVGVSAVGNAIVNLAPVAPSAAVYASQAAKLANDFSVSMKHLANAGGNYSKFATTDPTVVNQWITKALTMSNNFVTNSIDSYYTVVNMNEAIGTNGETFIKVVFTTTGRIITAYPLK